MALAPYTLFIDNVAFPGAGQGPGSGTYEVTSTGITFSSGTTWTYQGSGTFIGFSNIEGATTPVSDMEIGDTSYVSYIYTSYHTGPSEGGPLYLYSVSSGVTDLTNTTWVFNNSISTPPTSISLNFESNSSTYTYMSDDKADLVYSNSDQKADDHVYYFNSSVWVDNNYKTIYITGGEDVTNAAIIGWLVANATQVLPDPFIITYNNEEIYSTSQDGSVTLSCANKLMASDITVTGNNLGSIDINYGGSTITTATGSFTKTLSCAGKIMSTDIVINIVISNYDYDLTDGSLTIFSAPYTFENGVITI